VNLNEQEKMKMECATVKQICDAMFKLAKSGEVSVGDIVREMEQTNSVRDTPQLRERIKEQCELAWGIEAHARRIAAGTEKMLTIPERRNRNSVASKKSQQ
jgi:hypothetical protein